MQNSFYRSPVARDDLRELANKSELRAWLHASGHILLLIATGTGVVLAFNAELYWVALALLFVFGTIFSFLGWAGASHELSHNSVFKSVKVNQFWLTFFSFLHLNNHVIFKRTHPKHHAHTLHQGIDKEVNPNVVLTKLDIFELLTFNLRSLIVKLKFHWLNSIGDIRGDWVIELFKNNPRAMKKLTKWSRTVLIGHAVLVAIFLATGYWYLIFLVNLGSFWGNFIPTVFAITQHKGLLENSYDYRESSRSLKICSAFEFLYWGMNYHIEHHMYPNVPFYNLGKLSTMIKEDLPKPTQGLWQAIKLVV